MTGRVGVLAVGGLGEDVSKRLAALGPIAAGLTIDHIPGQPGNARATRALAMLALRRALAGRGAIPAEHAFGLAALPGPAGEFHLALQTIRATIARALGPPFDAGRAVLDLVARAVGIADRVPSEHDEPALPPGAFREVEVDAEACRHAGLADLLAGRRDRIGFHLRGNGRHEPADDEDHPDLILPGSFRPFHAGHAAMAEAAARWAGRPCGFDLSLFHPEKPPLDYVALASRLRGFGDAVGRLTLTNAPTYVEKARVHPGATFVVGHDAASRLFDPSFYGGIVGRDAMLDELEGLGTRFLVFGRVDGSGRFRDAIDDPEVVGFLARHATIIPESEFRLDLSSTAIRSTIGEDLD